MKKICQNDLEELHALVNRLLAEIERYSHVADYLPKTLTNELDKLDRKVIEELQKREY